MIFLLALFITITANAAEPLLDFDAVASGSAYKAQGPSAIFQSHFPHFVLKEAIPTGAAGVLRWFEHEEALSPEYILNAKLLSFEEGYWRLDFQITRVKTFDDGGTLFVPMCTASQLFASPEQMELLRRVEMFCWASQIDDEVNRRQVFDLTVRAN